jgi:hypothetical protein
MIGCETYLRRFHLEKDPAYARVRISRRVASYDNKLSRTGHQHETPARTETTLRTIEIGLFIQYPAPAPKQYISTIAQKSIFTHTLASNLG